MNFQSFSKRVFFLTTLLFFFIGAPHGFADDSKKLFGAKDFTLDNGIRVIAIENPRAPVVTHMVWYGVGSADEPKGQSGIAHYLEHLMFKGSLKLDPGEFSETVKSLGGNDNAFTSRDYTAYFQTIASRYLEDVMKLESERMLYMDAPEGEAASELDVVLEERRQRLENNPEAELFAAAAYALYYGHPYAIPIIGWKHDVEALTLEKAKAFYKKWYHPENATLIVSGDVDAKKLKKLAKRTMAVFQKLKKQPLEQT